MASWLDFQPILAGLKTQTAAGNVALTTGAGVIVKKTSGAATQVTLPNINPAEPILQFIVDGKGDAASNNITVIGYNSQTINGASSYVMSINYQGALFCSNGTEWNVVATFGTASGGAAAFTNLTSNNLTGLADPFPIAGLAGSSSAGGAVTLTGGAGNGTGNAGGALTQAGGAGANGTTVVGGVGGAWIGRGGAAGTATSGTGGAGGASTVGGAAGGTATTGTGGAGGANTLTSGAGGAASGAAGIGGIGGAWAGSAGVGGASASGTGGVGGAGGTWVGSAGAGGAAAGTSASGAGGAWTGRAGAAGAKTGTGAAVGGIGGAWAAGGGAGGATASSSSNAGGAAGTTTLAGGNGGSASAGTGNGGQAGSVILAGGTGGTSAGGTAGVNGAVITRGLTFAHQVSAPAAKTTTTTLTAAEILGGLLTANQGAAGAASYTAPLGTDLAAALPTDFATGDSFDFTIVNISTNAAEIVTVVGNTGTTAVGNMTIAANGATTSQAWGTFRVRQTGSGTFSFYRIG